MEVPRLYCYVESPWYALLSSPLAYFWDGASLATLGMPPFFVNGIIGYPTEFAYKSFQFLFLCIVTCEPIVIYLFTKILTVDE